MSKWALKKENPAATVQADLAFASVFQMTFLFFMMLILLIPMFVMASIPKMEAKKVTEAKVKAPVKMWGDIMVTIQWQDKEDIDVDLWIKSPDEPLSVGYSRTRGRTFALLKDVTGIANNPTGYMREVAFGDSMPDGRYTVNIHLYRNGSTLTKVFVDVQILSVGGLETVAIVKRRVQLTRIGQEITIANFTMKNGRVVGTPDEQFVPLRSAQGVGGGGS